MVMQIFIQKLMNGQYRSHINDRHTKIRRSLPILNSRATLALISCSEMRKIDYNDHKPTQ